MAKKLTDLIPKNGEKDKKLNGKNRFAFKVKVNLWTVVSIGMIVLLVASFVVSNSQVQIPTEKIDVSTSLNDIKDGKTEKLVIQSGKIIAKYKDGTSKFAVMEEGQVFSDLLESAKIDPSTISYTATDQTMNKAIMEALSTVAILGGMAAVFFFLMRSQNKGAQDMFSFGKSRAKLFAKGKQDVKFSDVAGVDEAKKELVEIVDFLKAPEKYRKIGARTPKGVLLYGPAGVGKTILARAVAGEAGVPFFSMAGSEFMEMLVGVGASRVRDIFSQAKASAPSIIFIDEIDAIGRQRGRGFAAGHDEREQTLNQILVEMDGFTPNDQVTVIAATNRGDLLDPALLRPGRFDRRVVLDMPDKEGREAILKIHAKGKRFGKNINWERIANRTVGFSGADLENMLNEAAIHAARADKETISMEDIEEAATKVKLGPAKKRIQSAEDKKITAYHEAGHAIVTYVLPKMDPVHRISIVARGMSLGHTLIPPAADRTHDSKSRLMAQIAAMLGGRAAEEIVFNEMTSGAASDIEKVTSLARAMVVNFGMSSLGPISFDSQSEYGEFGTLDSYESAKVSQATLEKIDLEVRKIVDESYKLAVTTVKANRKKLDAVAVALIEKENLDRDEFEKLMEDK